MMKTSELLAKRKQLIERKNCELAELQNTAGESKMAGVAFLWDRKIRQIDKQLADIEKSELAKNAKRILSCVTR
jgi:hypothetical protein